MENDLMNKYKSMIKISKPVEGESNDDDRIQKVLGEVLKHMDKNDVREILHEVLTDVYLQAMESKKMTTNDKN
jgi:hypothetical protein